jgi:glycosyltransferase involved in cell wall biosynthesis
VKLHVLGFPHTETTAAFSFCAFTDRTRVFASMMTKTGYDVRLYAGEHNEAEVTEHVALTTAEEQRRWFPWYDGSQVFNAFDANDEPWREFNARAIAAIRERAEPGDVLCVTMGTSHRPVAEQLPDLLAVETGVGYSGVWSPYRVFESHAWRAFLAAKEPTDTVRFYDTVIPRAWEVDDFPAGNGDGGYFLFVGRLIGRKGPHIAALACQRLGAKLLVAGQGAKHVTEGQITCEDGTVLEGDVHYVGVVGPEERAKLMSGAVALFAPTMYFEPLGGVAIEAMLTGTPAITSDYGAFTETVEHGVTGYRASTLAEFVGATVCAKLLDRSAIRQRAISRYSTEAVAPQFLAYLDRLATLHEDGWYT